MNIKIILLVIVLFSISKTYSQDLTGKWESSNTKSIPRVFIFSSDSTGQYLIGSKDVIIAQYTSSTVDESTLKVNYKLAQGTDTIWIYAIVVFKNEDEIDIKIFTSENDRNNSLNNPSITYVNFIRSTQ